MTCIQKTAAFAAALFTLSAALLSCGADAQTTPSQTINMDKETTAALPAETESAGLFDDRQSVSDNIPELDFGGADFRSITQVGTESDIYIEGESGDILDDAIYSRNRTIEDRFNIHITAPQAMNRTEISSAVKKSVTAGDDAYDLVIGQMAQSGVDVLGGYFQNWYELPYVNFSQPWYPQTMVREASINDRMYIITSDMSLTYMLFSYCVFYDKKLSGTYDLPDLYGMVKDGKWTLDAMFSMAKDVYADLDNSNDRSENDLYGMYATLDGCTVGAYFYGIDQPYASIKDNQLSMDINSPKTVEALAYLRTALNSTGIMKTATNTLQAADAFSKGNYLFAPSILRYTLYSLRSTENEWGILPFPKWDEAQDSYHTAIDAGGSVLTVPTTAANTELIGAVTEALSCEAWKSVMPVFYDIVMDSKVANDEQTAEMLDIIFDTRVIDFAYLYDGWNGWVFKMNDLFQNTTEFASFYAKNEKFVTKHYQKVLDIFLEGLE